jgi:hypothetical protein
MQTIVLALMLCDAPSVSVNYCAEPSAMVGVVGVSVMLLIVAFEKVRVVVPGAEGVGSTVTPSLRDLDSALKNFALRLECQ